MNRSIRLVAVFAIILTIILLINLTVVQAFQEDKYANHGWLSPGPVRRLPSGTIAQRNPEWHGSFAVKHQLARCDHR